MANDPAQAIDYFAGVINSGLRGKANWEALANAYLTKGELGSAALCYERSGRSGLAGTLAVMADREHCRVTGEAATSELAWLPNTLLPLIEAEINGIHVNLLVDTAAGDLVLDEQVAVTAGVPHGGQERRHFAGGLPATVTYGHVDRLQMGDYAVHDMLTQILDLQSRFATYAAGLTVHGILGVSILSRFVSVLDFQQRYLRLLPWTAQSFSRVPDQEEIPIWLADQHFILAQAETPSMDPAQWVIDTGMSGAAFAISSATAEAADLAISPDTAEQGMGGGGTIAGRRVKLPSLKLAALARQQVEGIALESFPLQQRFGFHTAGLLACDYFQGTVLVLDFSRMTLSLSGQV
jgi:predicted aspartyl protease